MKNPSPNPDTNTRARTGRLSRLRIVRPLRVAFRCCWILLILALLLVGYLALVGFPKMVTDRIRDAFAEQGYDVRIQRIRFNPFDGIVADRCHVFLHADDRYPAVEAEHIVLGFDPRVWARGDAGLRRVRVRNAVFRVSTTGALLDLASPHVVQLLDAQAEITLEETGVRVAGMRAMLNGLDIRGRGYVARDPEREQREGPMTPVILREFMARNEAWLPALVEEWSTIVFKERAEARFDFFIDQSDLRRNEMALTMSGGATRFRGLSFDGWDIEAHWDGRYIRLPTCRVYHEERRLEGQAELDIEHQIVSARLYMSLLPVYWRNLMPAILREYMERARVHAFGSTEADLTLGPAPVTEIGRRINGWVKAEELEAHGVWLESVRTDVSREGDLVVLTNIEAVVGKNNGQGPASGHASYHLTDGVYQGEVKASFDPHAVLSVAGYSEIAAEIIQSVAVGETLPSLDVTFSGTIPPDPTFNFQGDIHGRDFLFRGSIIKSFESTFLVTNKVMRIDPLRVEREEGRIAGWYQQDFNEDMVDLDVVSSVDPKVLARVAGGTVDRILRQFRFEGPVDVQVRGRVDYERHQLTDYTAVGHAEQVGWRWITAEHCTMEWIAQADRITMTNVLMQIYDGTLEGHVRLEGIGDDAVHYETTGRLTDARFDEFLRQIRQSEEDLQEGRVSARWQLSGLAEDDWRATLAGDGRIRIRDGQVFQIPLFGGLSRLLGRIVPQLAFAVQTDARADFDIGERLIRSDNLNIEGRVLSLRAHGYYHLDDALDFKVQIHPFRRGLVVDAVRLVTWPVSRLLQLRLTGTLTEPEWVVDSLPRELWQYFEREE